MNIYIDEKLMKFMEEDKRRLKKMNNFWKKAKRYDMIIGLLLCLGALELIISLIIIGLYGSVIDNPHVKYVLIILFVKGAVLATLGAVIMGSRSVYKTWLFRRSHKKYDGHFSA